MALTLYEKNLVLRMRKLAIPWSQIKFILGKDHDFDIFTFMEEEEHLEISDYYSSDGDLSLELRQRGKRNTIMGRYGSIESVSLSRSLSSASSEVSLSDGTDKSSSLAVITTVALNPANSIAKKKCIKIRNPISKPAKASIIDVEEKYRKFKPKGARKPIAYLSHGPVEVVEIRSSVSLSPEPVSHHFPFSSDLTQPIIISDDSLSDEFPNLNIVLGEASSSESLSSFCERS